MGTLKPKVISKQDINNSDNKNIKKINYSSY